MLGYVRPVEGPVHAGRSPEANRGLGATSPSGALMLLAAVATAAKYDFRDRDVLMKIIGTFILPAVAIAAGSALTRGKLAVDGSPDDGKLGSKV